MLNIWDHSRLPDACYPVADLPCLDGIYTRWNNRPGSAAHPFFSRKFLRDGEELLQLSQNVVDKITEFSGVKGAKIIDISGRQRMLSQRISKFYIAYYYGLRTPQIIESFNQAVQEYENALK